MNAPLLGSNGIPSRIAEFSALIYQYLFLIFLSILPRGTISTSLLPRSYDLDDSILGSMDDLDFPVRCKRIPVFSFYRLFGIISLFRIIMGLMIVQVRCCYIFLDGWLEIICFRNRWLANYYVFNHKLTVIII